MLFIVGQQISAITLSGLIKGMDGETIPGVVVMLCDSANIQQAYTTSNGNGQFKIECSKQLYDYGTISFSCLGFGVKTMSVKQFDKIKEVTLEEEAFELKEVVVRVPQISAKGDTLTYNVASFRSGSDRSIEDIIKKLPGISVSENGCIYYNGEAINKFYIEGMDVVGGRYAVATRNISPEDVVSVNVYENHQPKRVLKDHVYSEKAALNLKLKKKSLLKPIGYIKGGLGVTDDSKLNYLGEWFTMLISPNYQMLATAKANDMGISYLDETRLLVSEDENKGTSVYGVYPITPFGSAKIPTSRYYDNRSYSTSVNSRLRINDYFSAVFNADYSDERNIYDNHETISSGDGDSGMTTIVENIGNKLNMRETKFKVNLENNSDRKYMSNITSFVGHFNNNKYLVEQSQNVLQTIKTNDYNVSNHFNGIYHVANSIIDFKANINISNTPLNRLTAVKDSLDLIRQSITGLSFTTLEELGYSWQLSQLSTIGVKTTFNSAYDIYKTISTDDEISDNLRGYKLITTVEPTYQYNRRNNFIIDLSLPIKMTNINFDDRINDKRFPTNKVDIDLKASLNYNAPFNLKTRLTVGHQKSYGDITNYISEPIFTSYLKKTYLGTGELNSRESSYLNSMLSYRNVMSGIFSTVTFLIRHSESNNLTGTDISSSMITTSVVRAKTPSNLYNMLANISKKVYDWNTTFTFEGSCESIDKSVLRQNVETKLGIDSYTIRTTINSNPIRDYLNLILDASYSNTRQRLQKYGINNNSVQISCNMFLAAHPMKNFEIYVKGYFNRCNVFGDTYKNCTFVDCGASYRFRSFELEVSVRNICNLRSYQYFYLQNSDIYSYSFNLRPLEIGTTVKYLF